MRVNRKTVGLAILAGLFLLLGCVGTSTSPKERAKILLSKAIEAENVKVTDRTYKLWYSIRTPEMELPTTTIRMRIQKRNEDMRAELVSETKLFGEPVEMESVVCCVGDKCCVKMKGEGVPPMEECMPREETSAEELLSTTMMGVNPSSAQLLSVIANFIDAAEKVEVLETPQEYEIKLTGAPSMILSAMALTSTEVPAEALKYLKSNVEISIDKSSWLVKKLRVTEQIKPPEGAKVPEELQNFVEEPIIKIGVELLEVKEPPAEIPCP